MPRYFVIDNSTGKCVKIVNCANTEIANKQCVDGQSLSVEYNIYNNCMVIPESYNNNIKSIETIRHTRDILLLNSDKYVLPDFPITDEARAKWIQYRQALRDMPETCDPENPIWPEMPA